MTDVIDLELILSALVGLLGFLCVGFRHLKYPRKLSLLHVTMLMTAMFFGLGPWIGFFFGGGYLAPETPKILWESYSIVALFILGLGCVEFLKRSSGRRLAVYDTVMHAQAIPWQVVMLSFLAIWGLRLTIASQYGILFSGTSTFERIARIPYWITVLQNILEVLSMACFIWSSVKLFFRSTIVEKGLAIAVLITGLGWAFMQSRRPFQLHALIVYYCYCVSFERISFRQVALAAGSFALMLGLIFPAFVRLRIAHDHLPQQDNAVDDLMDTLNGALQVTDDEQSVYYNANMSDRPLIIRFICRIVESQENYPYMKGDALVSGMIWAVPSSLYREKLNLPQTEQLIQIRYGHTLKDTSLTWPAAGCADFGILGGFIFGLILGAIVFGIEFFADRVRHTYPLIALCAIGGMYTPVALVEDDISSVFCVIRALIPLYAFAVFNGWFGITLFKPHERLDALEEESGQGAT